jgi:hypothetical protein
MNQMRTIHTFQKLGTLTSVFLTSLLISSHPVAAQQACVVTDAGKVVCGRLQQSANESFPQNSDRQQEIEDFVFTFKACRRKGAVVNCELTITNKGKDRDLRLNGTTFYDPAKHTRIIDATGRQYSVSNIESGGLKSQGYVSVKFAKDINYRTVLTFEEISNQISQVPLIELSVTYSDGPVTKTFAIQYRDIPILK